LVGSLDSGGTGVCDDHGHVESEDTVVTKNSSRQAWALDQARERRRVLDQARDEQDARVESATAAALLALEVRAAAERELAAATGELAAAVHALFAEGVGMDRAAALLEVEVADIRRLAKQGAGPVVPGPVSGLVVLPARTSGETAEDSRAG
jgi:hypothetical protein